MLFNITLSVHKCNVSVVALLSLPSSESKGNEVNESWQCV